MPIARLSIIAAAICAFALAVASLAAVARAEPGVVAAPTVIYLPLLANTPALQSDAEKAFADQVVALVNAERAKANCGPLAVSNSLTVAAQAHSEDMAANNYFSHTSLGGLSAGQRAAQAGYGSLYVGENIAAGNATPAAVMASWMESDGHRANILRCAYTQIGVGYYFEAGDTYPGGNWGYRHYWVQVFGRP